MSSLNMDLKGLKERIAAKQHAEGPPDTNAPSPSLSRTPPAELQPVVSAFMDRINNGKRHMGFANNRYGTEPGVFETIGAALQFVTYKTGGLKYHSS